MPVQLLPLPASFGAQIQIACDNAPCQTGMLMSAGKSKQRAIETARDDGFLITGSEGSEHVLCPECAKRKQTP